MIKNLRAVFWLLAIFNISAHASSFDINLNSDAFRGTVAAYMAKKTVGDFGFLHSSYRNANDDDTGFHAGLNFVVNSWRFGGRLFYVSPGAADAMALGLGAQARFFLTRSITFGGHFYYAPQAFSFMDAEGYTDFELRLAAKLSRKAYMYLGYRSLKVKLFSTTNKVELDDNMHIGLKLYF